MNAVEYAARAELREATQAYLHRARSWVGIVCQNRPMEIDEVARGAPGVDLSLLWLRYSATTLHQNWGPGLNDLENVFRKHHRHAAAGDRGFGRQRAACHLRAQGLSS
jgi:hypothetical protein